MIVMLDTGYLITLGDKTRPNHSVAKQYFQALINAEYRMLVSPIVISEYAVRGDPQPLLEMGCFEFPEYNILHALKASCLKKETMPSVDLRDSDNTRPVIINDTQIIAQAAVENVTHILTEDVNTFYKTVNKLNKSGAIDITPIPLNQGYQPEKLNLLKQGKLEFPESDED